MVSTKTITKQKRSKILVTGGTGFIGKFVVQSLSKHYNVRVFARKNARIKKAEVFVGNILDNNDVKKALKGVDIIVHLAALMLGDEKEVYSFNVKSTELLVNAGIKSNAKKFVFLSSENVMWKNQSAYGESKKRCEEIVKKFDDHLILRSSAVYGKGSNAILGKVLDHIRKSKIILVPGNGKSLMQPIFVEDVAEYITNGIRYNIKGTYIIAGNSKITFDEFIDAVVKLLKVRRIKLHITLWLLHPIFFLLEKTLKNPPIKLSQIRNLNTNRVYDTSNSIKNLNHSPIGVEEGLKKTLF